MDKIRNILFNGNIGEIGEVGDMGDSNVGLEGFNDDDVKEISRGSSITHLDLYLDAIYNFQLKRTLMPS